MAATRAMRPVRCKNATGWCLPPKWESELRNHLEPDAANVDRAARRLAGTKTMLVIDEHVPFTDRDAGSRRMRFLIDLLRDRGWHAIFGSLDAREYEPYAGELRASEKRST